MVTKDDLRQETAAKILVVEDSATARDQVGRALRPAGFDLIYASHGIEGLAQIEAHPDLALVICDVNMPVMTGIEMLRRLKEEQKEVPVLMLTSEGQPELILQAKAAGARAWIVKPFDEALLVEAVRSMTV